MSSGERAFFSGGAIVLSLCLLGAGEATAADADGPPSVGHLVGPAPGLIPAPAEPENPYAEDPEAAEQGRRFFLAYNCYGCHGGRAGGGMGPSLRDGDWIYGGSPGAIYDSIAAGRPHAMPAWGVSLPPSIIWQLTSYILSLGTEQEPDAPQPLAANP